MDVITVKMSKLLNKQYTVGYSLSWEGVIKIIILAYNFAAEVNTLF